MFTNLSIFRAAPSKSNPRLNQSFPPAIKRGLLENPNHLLLIFPALNLHLPSGELTLLWQITMLLMGKSTISMVIFNSYVSHYQRVLMGFSS